MLLVGHQEGHLALAGKGPTQPFHKIPGWPGLGCIHIDTGTGYCKDKFAPIPMAAIRINMSSVQVRYALIRAVSAQVLF